ncbi:MAG: hypothetical protein D9V47_09250 [Clostridia bacterium]|nr:MAG: hypothetical protein D9V47_09250 [Clostridia bacterium]
MSRGLGEQQRQVLIALARHPERGRELPLRALKAEMWGTRPRYRLIGRQVVRDGAKLAAGHASNLNRVLASLERRGLVRQWVECDGGRRYRHIGLTNRGLSEYTR